MKAKQRQRCGWPGDDPLMVRYHDEEWGVPVHDDRKWFEFILLDAFQAGLSWKTVLHKRDAFHQVFYGFDPQRVAGMSEKAMADAMANPAIIRNRLKIRAAVKNAQAFLRLQETHGSFDDFIWAFTGGRVIRNHWKTLDRIPAKTDLSDTVSKALKQQGFTFVGSTICYSFLQAAGVVNDHLVGCFRHRELSEK
ncbi:DNA-3-methyladenine glycosylase I [Desulfosarcina sp.]|uniref:DNA-3-methyladenine glycosylase I n=1 Tax=Desulfosarcina sp. TaxID=2027861 RepID=UPI00356383A7